MSAILEATDLTVRFGGLRANDGIDLTVEEGQIAGLIGPNGAGKTTFIDALTGFTPATGSIVFDGHELLGRRPHERARAGLRRTWQSLELFDDLTVRDNLRVANDRSRMRDTALDVIRPRRHVESGSIDVALEAVGLTSLADRMPDELSQGQRKLVSTARALAGRPRLLCMDEPAAGLDTTESTALAAQLEQVRASGVTMLIVDHDMSLLLPLCDTLYVLEFGSVIAHGPPHDVVKDPRVIAAYLGTSGNGDGS
ncbi:MAG: ABC transporter ATP-binding protein [Actinomycetota bacterium]